MLERYIEGLDESSEPPVRPSQPAEVAAWARKIDERIPTGKPPGYHFHDSDNPQQGQRRYVRTVSHLGRLRAWIATQRQHLATWLQESTSEDGTLPDCKLQARLVVNVLHSSFL